MWKKMIDSISNKEIQDNKYLLDQIKDPFIRSRAEVCLNWYIRKAVKNKYYFYIFSFMTVVCPIISSIILDFADIDTSIKVVSSVFMGISTASAALLSILNVRENWGIYRNQAEILKSLLAQYSYDQEEEDLLKEMEGSMKKTHQQ